VVLMDVFANERLVEFLNVDSTRDLEEFVISQYFHILASDAVSNGHHRRRKVLKSV